MRIPCKNLFIFFSRKTGSEYARNFRAPSAYMYEEGAWKGAQGPPHLDPTPVSVLPSSHMNSDLPYSFPNIWYFTNISKSIAVYNYVLLQEEVAAPPPEEEMPAPTSATASWFSEVMELRQKAAEYRQRARGTHFSRSHLAQLYARNAELWDTHSVLSALSLESAQARSACDSYYKSSS